MQDNQGVPASPSGHSATPEPVVSALRASVPNAARVLVCGGRDYADELRLFRTLDYIHRGRIRVLMHGGARGADSLAGKWAREQGVPCRAYQADWNKHGRGAGPIRNQQMLDEGKPTLVVAFPGGAGTADMVRRARAAGIAIQNEIRRDSDTRPKDGDAKQGSTRE